MLENLNCYPCLSWTTFKNVFLSSSGLTGEDKKCRAVYFGFLLIPVAVVTLIAVVALKFRNSIDQNIQNIYRRLQGKTSAELTQEHLSQYLQSTEPSLDHLNKLQSKDLKLIAGFFEDFLSLATRLDKDPKSCIQSGVFQLVRKTPYNIIVKIPAIQEPNEQCQCVIKDELSKKEYVLPMTRWHFLKIFEGFIRSLPNVQTTAERVDVMGCDITLKKDNDFPKTLHDVLTGSKVIPQPHGQPLKPVSISSSTPSQLDKLTKDEVIQYVKSRNFSRLDKNSDYYDKDLEVLDGEKLEDILTLLQVFRSLFDELQAGICASEKAKSMQCFTFKCIALHIIEVKVNFDFDNSSQLLIGKLKSPLKQHTIFPLLEGFIHSLEVVLGTEDIRGENGFFIFLKGIEKDPFDKDHIKHSGGDGTAFSMKTAGGGSAQLSPAGLVEVPGDPRSTPPYY